MDISTLKNAIYVIGGNHIADDKKALVTELILKYPEFNFVTYEQISQGRGWSENIHNQIIENTIGAILISNQNDLDNIRHNSNDADRICISFGKGVHDMISNDIEESYDHDCVVVVRSKAQLSRSEQCFNLQYLELDEVNSNDYKINHAIYDVLYEDTIYLLDHLTFMKSKLTHPDKEIVDLSGSTRANGKSMFNTHLVAFENVQTATLEAIIQEDEPTNKISKIYHPEYYKNQEFKPLHFKTTNMLLLAYGCGLL